MHEDRIRRRLAELDATRQTEVRAALGGDVRVVRSRDDLATLS